MQALVGEAVAFVVGEGERQGRRLRPGEILKGAVIRLMDTAQPIMTAVGFGAEGGELRHEGIGFGLAGLLLLALDFARLDEALDVVGAHEGQDEGAEAMAIGIGQGGEPAHELARGGVVGLPEGGAEGLPISGQHLAAEVGEQMVLGLPVGHRGQAQCGEEPAEAGMEDQDDAAYGAGVTTARGHHDGGEGQVIGPGRADTVTVEVADEARVDVGPDAGAERIAARLGRVHDLGAMRPAKRCHDRGGMSAITAATDEGT